SAPPLPPHPPSPTLFPYTTLFRSHLADVARRAPRLLGSRQLQEVGEDPVEPPRLGAERRQRRRALLGREAGLVGQQRRRVDDSRDRKSTRLNSSHVAISYAVFCLK